MENKQIIFTEDYCTSLLVALNKGLSIPNYTLDGEDFVFQNKDVCTLKDFRVDKEKLQKINNENLNSLDSAIYLFEAFPDLTPLMAAYAPFWLYIAHVELTKYMRSRWRNVMENRGKQNDKAAQIDYIKNYWFPEVGDKTKTWLPNLWWAVYLTYDEKNKEDKYWLTRILFKQEDLRTRTLGTYTLFRHKPATVATLSFIKEHEDTTFNHAFQSKCRYMAKYLNYLGGCRLLSCMDEDFFTEMLNKKNADIAKVN